MDACALGTNSSLGPGAFPLGSVERWPTMGLVKQDPFGLPDPFDSSCIVFCHMLAPRPGVGFYYFIGAVMFGLCCAAVASAVFPLSSSGCSSAVNRQPLGGQSTRRDSWPLVTFQSQNGPCLGVCFGKYIIFGLRLDVFTVLSICHRSHSPVHINLCLFISK